MTMTSNRTTSKRVPHKSPRAATQSRSTERAADSRREITELVEQINRGLDAIENQADRLLAKLR